MLQRIFIGISQIFIVLFSISILSQEPWSLEQCVEIALQNNPKVHRAKLQYEKSLIDKQEAWQNVFPYVEAGADHSWSQGKSIDPTTNQFIEQTISSGNFSLAGGMPIFNGFRIFHDIRRTAAAEKAQHLQMEAAQEDLILAVIEAYITVLTASDLLQQAEKQLLVSQEQFTQANHLNEEGNIDPGDFHDLKGALNEYLNNLATAEKDLFYSRARLAGLLHLPEQTLPQLKPIDLLPSASSASANLFEMGKSRPFYALYDWQIKQAKARIGMVRSGYFPSLTLTAGLSSRYSSTSELPFWEQNENNLGKYVGFNLSIPIFQGFQVRNNLKRSKLDLQDWQWQKESVENELRETTSKVLFDLALVQRQYDNLLEQEDNYRESFRIAQTKFDLGASNSVILLTAKNKWENSQTQLVIKKYEWIFQKYLNDYYEGNLKMGNFLN